MNQSYLKNERNFFEKICTVDAVKMERTLDEEIAALEG